MRELYSPEFEETLRATVAVPQASPEVVNTLWERIANQSISKSSFAKKVKNNSRTIWAGSNGPVLRRNALRPLILIPLTLLIILGIIFATPVGRVVAERIAAFFTHAESSEKPILPQSNQTAAPQADVVGTQAPVPTATTENPSQFFFVQNQKGLTEAAPPDYINREQAAALAEYPLKEPQNLPDGYKFSYAIYFPENRSTFFVYGYQPQPKGEMILLTLSPTLIQDEVGPDAKVEKITVNGIEGELVQGGWIALAGETHETWEPRLAVTTLRWFDGDLYLKIQFHLNEPSSPAYLSLPQMLAVAESIRPAARDEPRPTPIPPSETFRKMEAQFGVNLLEPGILPAGYELVKAEQVPGRLQVYAQYRPATSGKTGPRLDISQIPLSGLPEIKPYDSDQVELVDILGRQGRLMMGVNDGSGSYPSWWLLWETPDLAMGVWYFPGPGVSEEEAKTMLIEIGKSMK